MGVVSSQMAAGKSFLESITGAAPAIQELATEMSQAGLSGGAAFDLLSKEADLATDKIAGPALQSIHDYTQGLVGITNAGQGTQDIFEGIVSQVTKTRDALIAQGKDGTSVMIAMQGDLQNVWDLQNKYNFKLDETSQKMVDDAEKAGLVGEAHKSAADQSVDALNRIADKLDVLIGKMGSGLPAATGAFTRSVADAATRNADATRRMVDDWGNVEDAVDHTTYGRSPTGVYGYIDSTSAAATETATQTGRMADAWGTVEDSANNVIGATNSISGAMATTTGKVTKNIDGLSDGFKALLAQMSSVSSSTVQLGTEAVSPDGQPTNPFEGYATGPQLISEADAITRIQQVAIHYTGHAANDAELAAMGAAYGYNGKGQISSLHLESFLKELVQHYLEGTYTGFAQGGEVTQQGPMISGHGTDTTMAFLTPGETVTTKSQSTSQHDTMAAMHAEMVGMRMDFSRYMARQADDIGRAVRDHAQLSQ